ncbi:hypothetical protein [Secundilactobacillus folii]|uniref:Uncharacterized protein n=1 Tax=Secundilactobacillus folii TaxID=2678357 RepID=A0A7X2XY97_9LACO|nr:hypothetical protein [Secundilactobacillus folii]MTV83128.1 hypothetical protein [Secundilactobacillus folii]
MTKKKRVTAPKKTNELNNVTIQLPKSVDINAFAEILETAFESHGIESYKVKYEVK